MKLEIEQPFVEALVQKFERLAPLKEQLKFARRAEIEFRRLTGAEADFLRGLYDRARAAFQARSARLDTLQEAFKDGCERFAPEDLERLPPAISIFGAIAGTRLLARNLRIEYSQTNGGVNRIVCTF
jgi:hypothetical protein